MSTPNEAVEFTVLGEPASKANSRKLVKNQKTGKPMFIKSQKARDYARAFKYQCPQPRVRLTGDVRVTIIIYYASRRPDLDESVILDCMEPEKVKLPNGKTQLIGGVYLNDRQVKEKHIFWALDKENPRAEIKVESMEP
jgi:Holliday junction resolvase RusA-like endonuclease